MRRLNVEAAVVVLLELCSHGEKELFCKLNLILEETGVNVIETAGVDQRLVGIRRNDLVGAPAQTGPVREAMPRPDGQMVDEIDVDGIARFAYIPRAGSVGPVEKTLQAEP